MASLLKIIQIWILYIGKWSPFMQLVHPFHQANPHFIRFFFFWKLMFIINIGFYLLASSVDQKYFNLQYFVCWLLIGIDHWSNFFLFLVNYLIMHFTSPQNFFSALAFQLFLMYVFELQYFMQFSLSLPKFSIL